MSVKRRKTANSTKRANSSKSKNSKNGSKMHPKSSNQLTMNVYETDSTTSSPTVSNYFGFARFSLEIAVEPYNANTNIDPQPMKCQLVFENGQQVSDDNDIKFETFPKSLTIMNGQCKFDVKIDTYSHYHDNRAFKLVFNLSETATRHIRPCETRPFKLVKHRLEIVDEPELKFYKDQGGRANCLQCQIVLKDSKRKKVSKRKVPLTAKLVYEDMSLAQSSRDILEILTQNLELKDGKCNVDFRINEVSKNHNKRAFRVLYECKNNDALYHDISSCVTQNIMVYSKRTVKKGKKGTSVRRGRTSNRKAKRIQKRKKMSASPPPSFSDESNFEDCDDDINDSEYEPSHKRRRRSTRSHYNNNNNNNDIMGIPPPHSMSTLPPQRNNDPNNTQMFVPPLSGLLPSIRPGILPRQGYCPPPFANMSKKNNMFKNDGNANKPANKNGNGLLGMMFDWCRLAGFVMSRLEWTQCGYEYDEGTHSIDTARPIYRCAYCLKYRNSAGWGEHEEWCQLRIALKEYNSKVKTMSSEWNYQNKTDPIGSMTSLDQTSSSPPPNNNNIQNRIETNKNNDTNNHNNHNNKSDDQANNNENKIAKVDNNMQLPSIMNNFAFASNGTTQHPFLPQIMSPNPSGNASLFYGAINQTQQNQLNSSFARSPNMNAPNMMYSSVKREVNKDQTQVNNNNNNVSLPSIMPRVNSVCREKSKHGFAAWDNDSQLLGFFDDSSTFVGLNQFDDDGSYNFDRFHGNTLTRNQSDDHMFYNEIQNNIFQSK